MTSDTIDIGARPRRWRSRWLWAAVAAALLVPFAILFVMAATSPDENIALGRNQIAQLPSGERLWLGTFWNHSDSLYTQLDAVVLFLDRDGKPVGQARGGADRLDPGEVFDIRARLPREAARMQVYQLRWTSGGHSEVLGPFRPWEFGYVNDAGCDEIRLAIGSCTPMRERR
jgi:hypothetical protein